MNENTIMKKIFAILAVSGTLTARAQDAQVTQFFNAQVLLNPAATGTQEEGSLRVSGAYRNTTFGSGMNAYQTGFLSLEGRIRTKWIPEGDRFGVGVFGYLDQSSAGALKSNYIGASVAYNKALNAAGTTRIGVGAQGVLVSRRLDFSKVYFEDQVGSGGFGTLPSRDAARGGSDSYFDVNAGIRIAHEGARSGVTVGAALQHVARPKESFWGADYQLPMRYNTHASAYTTIGGAGSKDRLTLQALYSSQGSLAYLQGGFVFTKNVELGATATSLDIGLLGRDTRALIPYLGIGYGHTHGAVTYDLTTRTEKQSGLNRQSLEITLTHSF
jgi:type IX secretion system PorP/SprF family membrane protein